MDLSSFTALLVEDDTNVRLTIRAMLHEMNFGTIQEAKDGDAALKIVQDNPDLFQIILCDWNMPGMTGIEFLKKIRHISPNVPFIMITARADQKSIIDAKMANVTAYIRKPFSFTELSGKVTSILSESFIKNL